MSNTSLLGAYGDNSGSALMFRNRIINGDMRIDQRAAGVSQAITLASVQYLSVDRFLTFQIGTGSTGTIGQVAVTDLPGFSWAQRYTVTSTTDPTAVTVGQRIEGFNIKDLENQLVTISFYIKASRSVNTAVQLLRTGTARSYVKNIAVTTSWVRQTITLTLESILNNANGNAMELLFRHRPDSSVLTSTEGSWVDADKQGITGTTYDFGNTQNDWIEITGVQLEAGPTATPFERRPYSVELSMAQRYYQKGYGQSAGWGDGLGGFRVFGWSIPEMRTAPNVTWTDAAGNASRVTTRANNGASTNNVNVGGVGAASSQWIQFDSFGTTTANGYVFNWFANAEL